MSWFVGTVAMRCGEPLDLAVEFGDRDGLVDEADARGLAPIDLVAGEEHALGLFRAEPVDPHGRGRAAPDARRHVADLCILGHHDHVAAQGDVGAAGDGEAVHLAERGLVGAPQTHESSVLRIMKE